VKTGSKGISSQRLARIGEFLVFGKNDPQVGKDANLIGKGHCPLCHQLLPKQEADRAPILLGMEGRAHERVKEDRYQMFVSKYSADGEPQTGMNPHAKTGGEYLIESLYCPNCYVVKDHGIKGTDDFETGMPIVNRRPIELTDFEIVAVVAYLQAKDTSGDYTKVTAIEDWERYFGKKFTFTPEEVNLYERQLTPPAPQ
jgi:hypothetical protein